MSVFEDKVKTIYEDFEMVPGSAPENYTPYTLNGLVELIASAAVALEDLNDPDADKSPEIQAKEAIMWGSKLKDYVNQLRKLMPRA
jgi:hypothetical protein